MESKENRREETAESLLLAAGNETLTQLKECNRHIVSSQINLHNLRIETECKISELLQNLAVELQKCNITPDEFQANPQLVLIKDAIKNEVINFILIEDAPTYELIKSKETVSYSIKEMYHWKGVKVNEVCLKHTQTARKAIKVSDVYYILFYINIFIY